MTDPEKSPSRIPDSRQNLLRHLPGVDRLLETAGQDPELAAAPKSLLTDCIRKALDDLRRAILADPAEVSAFDVSEANILELTRKSVQSAMALNLARVINATGIVVHTNLGRSLLAPQALDHLRTISSRYSNLEYNLATGRRGLRYTVVEDILCELSGAEAAMVVNNNAAAVLLCLDTVARHREVIVSRGELVEIGGSFRIPDVMEKSGAVLKEVGTTNRTHPRDYLQAISERTALLLKVHTSNFGIVGFTAAVSLPELVEMGKTHHLPVMEDLGSGTLIDFSKYTNLKEPTVRDSVRAGADLVTFSGDKLLGGPQAGIILGTGPVIEKIRQNPLTRALRIDKLTLAALESTLRLYRDEKAAIAAIPTLRLITRPVAEVQENALALKTLLDGHGDPRLSATAAPCAARAGGGSLPLFELPSWCVRIEIQGLSAARIEKIMRAGRPPVIGRIENDVFLMDLRTVADDEAPEIAAAVLNCLKEV